MHMPTPSTHRCSLWTHVLQKASLERERTRCPVLPLPTREKVVSGPRERCRSFFKFENCARIHPNVF